MDLLRGNVIFHMQNLAIILSNRIISDFLTEFPQILITHCLIPILKWFLS